MERISGKMTFSRDELQSLANAILLLMDYDEKNEIGLGMGFKENLNLLTRFNEQLDDMEAMDAIEAMEGEY